VGQTRQDLAVTFKPAIWYPVTFVLTGLNLVAAGFAAGSAEPWHAAVHMALALAFGLWAQRLRQGPGRSDHQARLEAVEAEVSRLEPLEAEVSDLRREISEAAERLDFAERLLAQGQESRRVGPER
jgi:hypothetical protein